jgi:integrase
VWSREVLKAEIKLLAIVRQRERGDYGFERQVLNSPVTAAHVSNLKDTTAPSPRLSEVIGAYVKEMLQVGKWRLKTEADHKAQLALFLEIIGDRPINEVGFADVRRYKEALTRLPPNRSKIPQYRDLSIDALLELKDTPPMALNTINRALTRVSTFLNWTVRHGYVSQNYAQGLSLPNPKRDDEERNHWSQEDLRRLFSPDNYNEQSRYRHTYMFWLPILGLFTGARLEEICQLHLSDIYQADDIWVIDINDAVGKKVKTKSSRRLIPLHPILGDIGFIST